MSVHAMTLLAVQLDMDTEQVCVGGSEGVWVCGRVSVCVCGGGCVCGRSPCSWIWTQNRGVCGGREDVWGGVGGGCVRSEGECACYAPPPRRAAGYGYGTEVCVWGGGRVCGWVGVRSEGECACYDPPPRRAAGYGHRTEVCVGGGRVCRGGGGVGSGGGCVRSEGEWVGGCVRSEGVWRWVCEE